MADSTPLRPLNYSREQQLFIQAAMHANNAYYITEEQLESSAAVFDYYTNNSHLKAYPENDTELKSLPDRSISHAPSKNIIFFTGKTGFEHESPFGYVVYQPSELERELDKNPNALKNNPMLRNTLNKVRTIIVSFRGTQDNHSKLSDWITNCRVFRKAAELCSESKGNIHSGFSKSFNSMKKSIKESIQTFLFDRVAEFPENLVSDLIKNTQVQVVGHSLGGALATICAYWLNKHPDLAPNPPMLFTFAAPKVADKDFFDAHETSDNAIDPDDEIRQIKHFRVERINSSPVMSTMKWLKEMCAGDFFHTGDIIPMIPLPFGFTNSGKLISIDAIPGGSARIQHDILGYLSDMELLQDELLLD